jgi:hypothetical protein
LLVAPRIGASLFVALDDGFVDGAIEMIGIGKSLMGEMMAFQRPSGGAWSLTDIDNATFGIKVDVP